MSSSVRMDLVQAFLRSLLLDDDTLSYLCDALDDADLDRSELQEFLEPFLSDADSACLLKLLPACSLHHVGPVFLEAAVCARQVLAEEAMSDNAVEIGEHVAECAFATLDVVQARASQNSKGQHVDGETDIDVEEHNVSTDYTYFQEAASIRKSDHVMIKDQPCRVMQITTSKIWKGPYRGCFQSQIIARGIFTGMKFEQAFPTAQHVTMPFVKCDEYQVLDIGNDGELSLMTATYDVKVDVNLPSLTDADHKIAECIKTDFNIGKTVLVTVQSACGTEKVIKYKSVD